jgi:uncharacterized UBP type Zn finger protein
MKISRLTHQAVKNVKEGTEWLSLCLCLTCGHVGCCNSSEGLHDTRHFTVTGHPTMTALPIDLGIGVILTNHIHRYTLYQ